MYVVTIVVGFPRPGESLSEIRRRLRFIAIRCPTNRPSVRVRGSSRPELENVNIFRHAAYLRNRHRSDNVQRRHAARIIQDVSIRDNNVQTRRKLCTVFFGRLTIDNGHALVPAVAAERRRLRATISKRFPVASFSNCSRVTSK